jgi:hypothetical protein
MIAIDPGVNGGIAILLPGQTATTFHMPATDGELLQKLKMAKETDAMTAYLEDIVMYVPSRLPSGKDLPSSRMITYGASWGTIKGMLFALGYRIVLVRPQKWQKALGLGNSRGMSKTAWKNKLKQRAEELFPGVKVTKATADALLILEAARKGALE